MKRGSDIAKKEIVAHKKIETLKNVWHEVVPGVKAMEKILQKNLEEMNISHANNKKVSGALHKETNYGVRKFDIKGKKWEFNKKVTSRTSLENIYKEVTKWKEDDRTEKAHKFCWNILDPIISKDLNNKISSGTFMLPYLHPVTSKEVKKIRMLEQLLTVDGLMPFGKWLFKNDDNHHIIILERIKEWKGLRNAKGNKAGIVVQLSEAYKQKKNHEPIYNRKGPWEDKKDWDMYTTEEYKFLFSLTKGELVQWEDWKIYQFKWVNVKKQMSFANTTISDEETRTAYPGSLKAQKIQIDALGHIRPAND